MTARRGPLGLPEDELVTCVSCGLCLPHCPTYRVTGRELASPRGRITAMRAVEAGTMPVDHAFLDAMDECVQCRGCEAACPSSVPFGHLIERTRVAVRPMRPRPARRRLLEWLGYSVVLPRHRLLVALTWVLVIGQRLRLVPRRFGVPRLSGRTLLTPVVSDDAAPDVVLFTGCVMDAWQREVHQAAARVLRACGGRVATPGVGGDCCGALHLHAGRDEEARRLARRVIASVPAGVEVVVDSAGCGAVMKDYGRIVGTPEGEAFSARVRDFAEWVAPWLALAPVSTTSPSRRSHPVVVVQDPCHLRHVQARHLPVREILGPHYELAETDDDGLCCGAGGVYQQEHPGLARAIRDRKAAAIRRAARGRDFVVCTANPGCALHLAGAGLPVAHPAELLAAATIPPHATTKETR